MTNKEHILKKHGAFYAGIDQAFASKRDDRIVYTKLANHLFVPSSNKYALECALAKLEREA